MPIYLGDLDFMNQVVRDTFLQLLKGLTGQERPTCILYGVQDNGYDITAGIVVLDGEIMPSKAAQMNDYGMLYGFNIESVYSGTRTFKDGSVRDCYEERIAVPVVDPGVSPQYPMRDKDLKYLIPNFGNLLVGVMESNLLAGNFTSIINNMAGSVRIRQQGDLFICNGTFKTNAPSTGVTELWTATGTYVAGLVGYINPGITLLSVIVDTAGVMEIIPAKLIIEKTADGKKFTARIEIASRDFAAGAVLSLSTVINTI